MENITLKELKLRNFRNYKYQKLENLGQLNIILGPNAVGKTNIIEAISLLSSAVSIKKNNLSHLILDGEQEAKIEGSVEGGSRQIDLCVKISPDAKKYLVNSKPKKLIDVKDLLLYVSFIPEDLQIIKSGSSMRRKVVDKLGSQISKSYYTVLKDYEKVLQYKSSLLKNCDNYDYLESVNSILAKVGARLYVLRSELIKKLLSKVEIFYKEITHENISLNYLYIPSYDARDCNSVANDISKYCAQIVRDEMTESTSETELLMQISKFAQDEKRTKRVLIGPHQDLIELYIDLKNVKMYASQGQQRSLILAIKLAEKAILKERFHKEPILLFDDVLSELDPQRTRCLTEILNTGSQSFITTTDLSCLDKKIIDSANIINLSKVSSD